jgi:hypothetical protein
MFVAITKHNDTGSPEISARQTYDECVEIVHEHFLGYGFIVKDGQPYDPGHENPKKPDDAIKCFSNVIMHNNKVAQFIHCDGDGPVGEIKQSK